MSKQDELDVRLYTLGQSSKRTGMFGLPLRATIVAGIGYIATLLVFMQSTFTTGLTVGAMTTIYLIPALLRFGNRTLYEVAQMRIQFWRAKLKGHTAYRSGPHSSVPGGRFRLPGFLARTELHVGLDMAGNWFGMIRDPGQNQYTVMMHCSPRGAEPWTLDDRNIMTREWGAWLSELSLSGDVVGATATVETVPSTGYDLKQSVLQDVDESAPGLARRIQAESVAQFTRNQADIRGWASVTFKATTTVARKDPEAMATDLGQRLPGLYEQLQHAGVSARPMGPGDIVGLAMSGWRPEVNDTVVAAEIDGEDLGVEWADAGPASANTEWDHYRHSEYTSRTFEMGLAPAAAFTDTVLRPLLAPHADVPRKRVTLVYRPFPAGDAVKMVENEHRDALNAVNSSRKVVGANAQLRLEQTEASRQSLARGGQLGRYSLLATLTVADTEQLSAVSAVLTQLGNRSQVGLHPTNGQQDAAFAAAMGLGVFLDQKSSISAFAKAG